MTTGWKTYGCFLIHPRSGLNLCGVLTRRYADDLLEAAGHMALTAISNLDSELCQRFADLNKPLGVTNAHIFQIRVGRHANLGGKGTQKVIGTESDIPSQQV